MILVGGYQVLTNLIQSSLENSSARVFFIPLWTRAFIISVFFRPSFVKLFVSIFLFWEKAAPAIPKNTFGSIVCSLNSVSEISDILIMADSIFGLGEKQVAGTLFIIFGVPKT